MGSDPSIFKLIFESAPDAIVIVNKEGKITLLNVQAEKFFGYAQEELLGESIEILVPDKLRKHHPEQRETYTKHPTYQPMGRGIDITARRKDGSILPVDISLSPLETQEHGLLIMASIRDIKHHRDLENKLQYLAEHDSLTGLINKAMLKDRVTQAISLSKRHKQYMAIYFMDLDGFKQVNDTYGHAVGDALLQEVAKRLIRNMRESDTLSRVGGDEFVLLLTEINQIKIVNEMADKIVKLFKEPFHINNNVEISITISMGIATYPKDAVDYESLLKKADLEMYSAKEMGKHNRMEDVGAGSKSQF